jgi:hypothetical protein
MIDFILGCIKFFILFFIGLGFALGVYVGYICQKYGVFLEIKQAFAH